MARLRIGTYLLATTALVIAVATADAATLSVHCGGSNGLTTIGAALRALRGESAGGPNTINVSGACLENVLIQNMDRLTIAGANRASITDASRGAADVVDIRNSNVTITGMTIDGKAGVTFDAVDCEQGSRCTLIDNTIEGDADAVGVYVLSSALIIGGTLQNTTSSGIWAGGGDVVAVGVLISGAPLGIGVVNGSRLATGIADPAVHPVARITPTTVVNSGGAGVWVTQGAQFRCGGCVIRNNSGDGIDADVSAAITVQPGYLLNGTSILPSISNNTGVGVMLGDLTSGSFRGPASAVTVTGNAQPDIVCNSALAVSRRALVAAGGPGHTNCSN